MGRLFNISGYKAAKVFEKAGWNKIGQVGGHLVMVKTGINVNLTIPQQHKELSVGTLRFLIRNSGLKVYEFLRLLELYVQA